jgi:L-seryl-tRNA(Ser) seleniumtransferase
MKRRDLIKYLSIAPLAGASVGTGVPFQSAIAAPAAKVKRDLIKELGLRTFINAAGSLTTHSASLMPDEVLEAINSSSKHFVMIREVQDKVGEKISAMCHAEAAMVTAGCWSALVLGTAGVLTGTDRSKLPLLPDVSKLPKNEVIVQKGHNIEYIHAIKTTGIIPVVIETAEELEKAFNPKTALTFFLNTAKANGKIMHEEWIAAAKRHNVPTIIDIAAEVPPVENLWKFNDLGFDLVCISGGKAIRGPQSAGILMGRKNLIAAARLNAPPDGGNIGRGMKVNKEEILGMYAALDRYINLDHDKQWKTWEAQAALISNAVTKFKGVTTKVVVPEGTNHFPQLQISLDPASVKMTARDLNTKLRTGSPSIETRGLIPGGSALAFYMLMLNPGEEKIIANRLTEELSKVANPG